MAGLINTSSFLNLSSTLVDSVDINTSMAVDATSTITTQDVSSNISVQSVASSCSSVQVVGNDIADTTLNVPARPRVIAVRCQGHRPGANLNVFCDGVNVTNNCAPGIVNPNNQIDTSDHSRDYNSVCRTGNWGSNISADANGHVNMHFRLGTSQIGSGVHKIEVADCSDITTQYSNVTSYSCAQFTAGPLPTTKTLATLTSVNPTISSTAALGSTIIIGPNIANNSASSTSPTASFSSCDPYAQVFTVTTPNGEAGIHCTSIDVFFASAPLTSTNGVRLYICQLTGGVPDMTNILPFSDCHLDLANVVISNVANSSAYTRFTFDSLVFLNADTSYAFVLTPDGDDPDYSIYQAAYGDIDTITGNQVFSSPNIGQCFYGGTGPTWTPINSEVCMFNVNRANFTTTSGTIVHQNDATDQIYLHYSLTFGNQGNTMLPSDIVYGANSLISNVVFLAQPQNQLYVNVTSASSHQFNVGDSVIIYNTGGGSLANGTFTVLGVQNSSAFSYTIVSACTTTSYSTTGSAYRLSTNPLNCNVSASGVVTFYDNVQNIIQCGSSSGKFNNFPLLQCHRFANSLVTTPNSSTLVCTANIYGIYDSKMHACMPQYSMITPAGCHHVHQIQRTCNTYSPVSTDVTTPITLTEGIETQFTDNNCIVASASNQNTYMSACSSLTIQTQMTSDSPLLSPVFDTIQSSVVLIENQIDPVVNNYNEFGTSGSAQSKYVSQVVTLASGQDSQDLTIYIDAYRPPGSDIQVWCRYLNSEDNDVITNKTWAPMRNTGINMFSSPTDPTDVHEFNYVTCSYYPMIQLSGTIACPASCTSVTGTGTYFTSELQDGWSISSVSNSTVSEIVSQIVSINSDTSLTLATPLLIAHTTDSIYLTPPSTTPWLSASSSTATNGTVQCSTTNNTIIGTSTSFTTQFSLGSIIGIDDDKQTVVSIANNTYLTVGAPWTSSNASANATNITADGLSYLNSNSMLYTTFIQFQIKVVLQSTNPNNPPILHDLRAIALQL